MLQLQHLSELAQYSGMESWLDPAKVADAEPEVPVKLPAAPAGAQLCVHLHAAGQPLGHKDTTVFQVPSSVFSEPAGVAPAPGSLNQLPPALQTSSISMIENNWSQGF